MTDRYQVMTLDDGTPFGLVRETRYAEGLSYSMLNRRTGAWEPSAVAPGYFNGTGGELDGTPVDAATAAALEQRLLEGLPIG